MEFLERFLKIEDVEALINFKKSWIYERIDEGEFPEGIPFGTARRWPLSHVQGWMQKRIEAAKEA